MVLFWLEYLNNPQTYSINGNLLPYRVLVRHLLLITVITQGLSVDP